MAGSRSFPRSPRATSPTVKSSSRAGARTLVIIDNRPLQREAWAELHAARKRLDKVSGELHRHEEIDVPAYDSWLHRTFPVSVTTLRQLHQEVLLKSYQVNRVQALSYATGRSVKKLWQELKEREANPEAYQNDPSPEEILDHDYDDEDDTDGWGSGWDTSTEDESSEGEDASSKRSQKSSRQTFDLEDSPSRRSTPPADQPAKDIYRRLVQRLHPDRGGEWTPGRERLWHQVQEAWTSGDVDWLTRLEVEWETANEVLNETSPLGRLLQAIEELQAARRDIERKLRDYRGSPPWRFTLSEKKRSSLHHRMEENFRHDISFLQRQLDHLNATIAAWERVSSSSRRGQQKRQIGGRERSSRTRRTR